MTNCPECNTELDDDIKMANEHRCVMCQSKIDYAKLYEQDKLPAVTFLREVFTYGDRPAIFLDCTSFFMKNGRGTICGRVPTEITRKGWCEAFKQFPHLPGGQQTRDVHISSTFLDCWLTDWKHDTEAIKLLKQFHFESSRPQLILGAQFHYYARRLDFFCVTSAPNYQEM